MKIEPFGMKIRKAREEKEMSMGEIAKELGVSPVYISDIELGKRNIPSDKEMLHKLSKILGIPYEELLNASVNQRDRIELKIKGKENLAFALARGWDAFEEKDIERIISAINKEE